MLGAAFILDDVKARVSFILRTWSNKKRERKKKPQNMRARQSMQMYYVCVHVCQSTKGCNMFFSGLRGDL